MITLSYVQWFKLHNQLYNDYIEELCHIDIDSLLRNEFQAHVKEPTARYKIGFEISFDDSKLECLFKLRYSEYL